jgi:3-methyladenine DNA glycosylase AlkC
MADAIKQFHPGFDSDRFVNLVFDGSWPDRELKARMRHTTICLHETLPDSYHDALDILLKAASQISGFDVMVFPDYVSLYGVDDWDLSLDALAALTKHSYSELAVRPFLARDPRRCMARMRIWAEDADDRVRRLASEGSRPRLPWAMALPQFKKDPSLILPILEKLKDDESEDVRRSVANNLNDISRDNPDLVLEICERWHGHSKGTDEIVKHACRSLLKAGDKRALLIFGYGDPARVKVNKLRLETKALIIGDDLRYSFEITIIDENPCKVRLEYAVYFRKAKGELSKKVFQIAEKSLDPGGHAFTRVHSFVDRSTRKHHAGEHQIAIIVNGEEMAIAAFELRK